MVKKETGKLGKKGKNSGKGIKLSSLYMFMNINNENWQ